MFTDVESSPVYTLIRDIEAQSKAERCNVNGIIAKKKNFSGVQWKRKWIEK